MKRRKKQKEHILDKFLVGTINDMFPPKCGKGRKESITPRQFSKITKLPINLTPPKQIEKVYL